MANLKAIAIDVLASNPSNEEVFLAADGNAFFNEAAARLHNESKGLRGAEAEPEGFTRADLKAEVKAEAAAIAKANDAALAHAAELALKAEQVKAAAKEALSMSPVEADAQAAKAAAKPAAAKAAAKPAAAPAAE